MDAIKLTLREGADIAFLQKLFTSLKEISAVEILNDGEESAAWDEIEDSAEFRIVMEQSELEYGKGQFVELTDELSDDIFKS